MTIVSGFDDAFQSTLDRVRGAAQAAADQAQSDTDQRRYLARRMIDVATPLFAAAYARLAAEGYTARRRATDNQRLLNNTTEPLMCTGDENGSWGELSKTFGPFRALGNYITADGQFIASTRVGIQVKDGDTGEPVFRTFTAPKYARAAPQREWWKTWYTFDDALEHQARSIASTVRMVSDLHSATDRDLFSNAILVDEASGAIYLVWCATDMPTIEHSEGVKSGVEPFAPGIEFRGRRIELLEDYVARLVARKIVLDGRIHR